MRWVRGGAKRERGRTSGGDKRYRRRSTDLSFREPKGGSRGGGKRPSERRRKSSLKKAGLSLKGLVHRQDTIAPI
jgi:hypothetical protein